MIRSSLVVLSIAAVALLAQSFLHFIGEARSQTPPPRTVAPLGASEGVAWYVDVAARKIVACRLRSDPAQLACSAHDMPGG